MIEGLLIVSGAVVGLLLTGYAATQQPRRKYEKKYKQYRDDLKEADVSKAPDTFLGMEITDKCACGSKVKKYDEHKLVATQDGTKWFRMCASCTRTKSPCHSL